MQKNSSRTRSLRQGLVGAMLGVAMAVAGTSGCKKNVTTPPVATTPLLPAQETQTHLNATFTLRSLEGSLGAAGALAQSLGLPFGANELRTMLLAKSGLPESLLAHLDLSQPLGIAVIGRQKGTSPYTAAAVMAKSPEAAASFVDASGTKIGEDKGAIHVRGVTGSDLWFYRDGALLVGSDTLEGLRTAGAHAMGSRHGHGEDLLVNLFPEAMARAEGTTLRAALDKARSDVLEVLRRDADKTGQLVPLEALERMVSSLFDAYAAPLADARQVDMAVSLDASRGLRLISRLHPAAGSPLAKSVGTVVPYVLEPAFKRQPPPAALFSGTYTAQTLERFRQAMDALGEVKLAGVKEVARGASALLAASQGQQSISFSMDKGFQYASVVELKPGTDPEALMGALDEALGPAGLGALMKEASKQAEKEARDAAAAGKGRTKAAALEFPRLTWKRQGLRGRLEMTLPRTARSAPARAREDMVLKQVLGGESLVYTVALTPGRMVVVSGIDGESQLAALLSGDGAGGVDPEVQRVLDETKNREGFLYVDLFRMLRPMLTAAAAVEPSLNQANTLLSFIPGIDKLRLPLISSYVGGEAFTMDLFVPRRTFENLATILRPLMGMGLGGSGGALAPGAE